MIEMKHFNILDANCFIYTVEIESWFFDMNKLLCFVFDDKLML